MNHPMFKNDTRAGAGGDRPSAEELHRMQTTTSGGMKKINAADMQDPDWAMKNQMSGGIGMGGGKKVSLEVSMYETEKWKKNTMADATKHQKKKNQINSLAHEAIKMEAELLDRGASQRLTKSQTSMKYGW